MSQDQLEYRNVSREDYGAMAQGSMRIAREHLKYQNRATGKVSTVNANDIAEVRWLRVGNANGLKVVTKAGVLHRFVGLPDSDFAKLQAFAREHWRKDVERQEQSVTGWNFGEAAVEGQTLVFRVDERIAFEIPLGNVAQCPAGGHKSELTLEFHANEDAPVQLCELRLHKPAGNDGEGEDAVEEFRQQVMRHVEGETDAPLVTLMEVLCATPRGRYDIKVFANRLAFHGKSYDYKIPFNSISRLFLLPHKDQRRVFLVLSIHPPVRQGQTRYPFIVLECLLDEEVSLELGGGHQRLEQLVTDAETRTIEGRLYDVLTKIFRLLTNLQITLPHGTDREAMTCPVFSCAFRQASGFLYPLENGFMFVHKPPMYLRFDEIDNVHFARSDASTRFFDFEIVQRNGTTLNFSSIPKEEYDALFDFVEKKRLKVRNAKRLEHRAAGEDAFAGSDDEELDPYREKLKAARRTRRTPKTTISTSLGSSASRRRSGTPRRAAAASRTKTSDGDVSDDLVAGSSKKATKPKKRKVPKDAEEPKDGEPKRTRRSKAVDEPSPSKKAIFREFVDDSE
ncbi:FACT complex subunit SSRP1 [Aphelenchoides fujianensis]|nr:FACT complex subunit SSRP1 [Aphelenchoides fujianensis]